METNEVVVKMEKPKSLGVVPTARAKVTTNIVGTLAGGALAWYLTKKYTGIQSIWLYGAIIATGAITGAYVSSAIKSKF